MSRRVPSVSDFRLPASGAQSGWRMPSGHRLIEFAVASSLVAPALALALRHVMRAWQPRRRGNA